MNITQALRHSRAEFTPVRQMPSLDADRKTALWFFETGAMGAQSCASRDYYAVVRKKNVEVIRYALTLLDWTPTMARHFADTIDGRGTQYEMMLAARLWRYGAHKVKRHAA